MRSVRDSYRNIKCFSVAYVRDRLACRQSVFHTWPGVCISCCCPGQQSSLSSFVMYFGAPWTKKNTFYSVNFVWKFVNTYSLKYQLKYMSSFYMRNTCEVLAKYNCGSVRYTVPRSCWEMFPLQSSPWHKGIDWIWTLEWFRVRGNASGVEFMLSWKRCCTCG